MTNLRYIPAIDEILVLPQLQGLLQRFSREFVVQQLRQAVDEVRQEIRQSGEKSSKMALTEKILARLEILSARANQGTLQTVINGTGVVLHTNLGRAPLGERALQYLQDMGRNYNNLEFNLETGERGSRYQHVEDLLVKLTGAEAGLVVNNNAAAVMLSLTSLAQNREVIVSRGQLIEIGGAFRIPEVMKQSGAKLVEVGTTNKTYLSDYAGAVNENTALLFSAHTSNYKIVGFSQEVSLPELVALGKERSLPVLHDLGSGILADLGEWGLKEEPTVQASVASGADIITFSGDKLLGGPQAGIIVGKQPYINAMKKHQLTRALRVDKLIIAALEGTLLEYLTGYPRQGIPVLKMLTAEAPALADRAEQLAQAVQEKLAGSGQLASVKVVKTEDMVGGGAYPTYKIPGYGLQIAFTGGILEKLTRRLRIMRPAVLTRTQEDTMLISMRTLLSGDEQILIEMLGRALADETTNGEEPCKD